MNINPYFKNKIIVAPILSDAKTLIVYRDNGEEIVIKINAENKTISSEIKLTIDEVNYLRDSYL